MDARVKPAHDEGIVLATAPALQRSVPQELHHSASKTRVNALMALRPGHGEGVHRLFGRLLHRGPLPSRNFPFPQMLKSASASATPIWRTTQAKVATWFGF